MARLKFSAWRDAADQFKAAGLTVALLIADGRDTAHRTDPATAFAWLKQHRIPFPAGTLTDEAFRRLTTAHRQLFGAIFNLPIPTSFLLDGKGRLAAIYRGSVSTERILPMSPWPMTNAPPPRTKVLFLFHNLLTLGALSGSAVEVIPVFRITHRPHCTRILSVIIPADF